MPTWHRIPLTLSDLHLPTTLRSGQSFRWKLSAPGQYSCALRGRLITLYQDSQHLYYRFALPPSIHNTSVTTTAASPRTGIKKEEEPLTPQTESDQNTEAEGEEEVEETRQFLRWYFNLDCDLGAMYERWSAVDGNFKKRAGAFAGVRVLRQDAWETVVGFVCSSCNNIKRIMQMMDKLCANYGPLIGYIDDVPYYDMPSAAALVNPRVKEHLRELGFGYRAAYLFDTAHQVMREKSGWLDSLRNPESPAFGKGARQAGVWKPQGRDGYTKAHQAMIGLRGVGDKVADCVCLFGLGWGEAVPVDTHVWQIAQRDYGFGKGKHKSLTKATYEAVANHFRNLWGKEAGWAHSVLFTADLRDFASQVKIEVVKTEIAVKNEEVYSTLSKSLVDSASFATPIKTIKREPSTPAVASVSRSTLDDSSGEDSFIPKREIKKEIKEESYASAVTSESSSAFDDSSDEDSFMPKQEIKKETKKEIKVEVKQEIQPDLSIRTKKRKATALIKKEEKINVKTEAAEDSGKRRRSGRLRR